jgi:hypothetical protein
MKPHDKLTIFRNRHRVQELTLFRELVESYFAQSERDPDDVPLDWAGAQAARSRINQMLPRILQIVRAAGLGPALATGTTTDPGFPLGRIEVLRRIFASRDDEGAEQEILDVLDMAVGVYQGDRYLALARTFNPLHYLGVALAFLGRGPRRVLAALGLGGQRPLARLGAEDLARLEAAAARLAEAEDLIASRLAAWQDRQAVRQADYARQLAELAERLDFAERVLARSRPADRLEAPQEPEVSTPV